MRSFRAAVRSNRSYGKVGGRVQPPGWRIFGLLCFAIVSALFLTVSAHAADRPVRIVVLGDSLSAGFGLMAPDALPAKLERALKAKGLDVAIENAGVSGDTAAGGLARLDWSVPEGTEAVILELGANDVLRGAHPQQTRASLEAIVKKLKERKIAVLIAGMYAPRNLGADYVKSFDAIYPELATEHGLILYPFILEGVAGVSYLNLSDGMHPTAAGVDIMVQGLLPKAEELVARVKATRAP